MQIDWVLKSFESLTPLQLYEILKLRSQVFVVEQQCVFLDMDDKDQACFHLMGFNEEEVLVAYTRLVPIGVAYDGYPSIGRVVTSPIARGSGLGRVLMQESIAQLKKMIGNMPIKIGAQLYLKSFYESLGFQQFGEIYDEDGIDHLPMLRAAD